MADNPDFEAFKKQREQMYDTVDDAWPFSVTRQKAEEKSIKKIVADIRRQQTRLNNRKCSKAASRPSEG